MQFYYKIIILHTSTYLCIVSPVYISVYGVYVSSLRDWTNGYLICSVDIKYKDTYGSTFTDLYNIQTYKL